MVIYISLGILGFYHIGIIYFNMVLYISVGILGLHHGLYEKTLV